MGSANIEHADLLRSKLASTYGHGDMGRTLRRTVGAHVQYRHICRNARERHNKSTLLHYISTTGQYVDRPHCVNTEEFLHYRRRQFMETTEGDDSGSIDYSVDSFGCYLTERSGQIILTSQR